MEKNTDFYKQILDNLYDGVYFVDNDRVITYWNKGAERITGYNPTEVVGRRCFDNILVHCNEKGVNVCKGMCPLVKSINNGSLQEQQLFLLHKAGHRVPVFIRSIPLRDDLDRVIGAVEIFSDNTQQLAVNEKMKQLAKLAFSDGLTGLSNRRYAEMKLASMLEETRKDFPPFGFICIETETSDDSSIKTIANTISANIQPGDMACRWENGSFVVFTPNSKKSLLILLADKLRTLIITSNTNAVNVLAAIGVTASRKTDTVDSLFSRAAMLAQNSLDAGSSSVTIDPNI